MAEQRVFHRIQMLRRELGWQIGDNAGSNNMIDFLEKKSGDWRKTLRESQMVCAACFVVRDTATALMWLASQKGGLYQIKFKRTVDFLRDRVRAERKAWQPLEVVGNDNFVYDQADA